MIFPSSLAGRSRINVSREVQRKEGGTNRCHTLMGMCTQPTGPNPRPGISTNKPTSKSLGLALSCRKHTQNSVVKESMAAQNKPKKLGRSKSRAANHPLTKNSNKQISSKPRTLGPQPRATFSIERSQRPSFHHDRQLLPTSVSTRSRGDVPFLASSGPPNDRSSRDSMTTSRCFNSSSLCPNTRSRPPGRREFSGEVLRGCLPLDLDVPERPG